MTARTEAIARIVDPDIWATHDEIAARADGREWLAKQHGKSVQGEGRWGMSLAKARAIEALLGLDEDSLKYALIAAYQSGAEDVHEAWLRGSPARDPDFTEASHDYAVAALAKLKGSTDGR